MGDFNRKVEETTSRVGKTVGETTERVEKEASEFIKYLNDEVVPAVRQHSTKALRVAAQKMHELGELHGPAFGQPQMKRISLLFCLCLVFGGVQSQTCPGSGRTCASG